MLEEVILPLRQDLGPQAIETAEEFITLNCIYEQLLKKQIVAERFKVKFPPR